MTTALLWLWSWFVRNFMRFSFWDSAPCSPWINKWEKLKKKWQQLYYDCGADLWEISWDALFETLLPALLENKLKKTEKQLQQLYYDCGVDLWEISSDALFDIRFSFWDSAPCSASKKKIDSSTPMTLWKCFLRIFIKCSFRDSSSRCAWGKKNGSSTLTVELICGKIRHMTLVGLFFTLCLEGEKGKKKQKTALLWLWS